MILKRVAGPKKRSRNGAALLGERKNIATVTVMGGREV